MKLRLTRRAEDDLDSIAAYLFGRSPQAAERVQQQLAAALQIIAVHPQAGRSIKRGLRRLAVPRLPYLVFYRVDEPAGLVSVITIRHGARRQP